MWLDSTAVMGTSDNARISSFIQILRKILGTIFMKTKQLSRFLKLIDRVCGIQKNKAGCPVFGDWA